MSEKRYSRQTGGQSGETSQINKNLGSMEPDELIDELADKWDAMDDKDFDPQVIDAYLAALDEKESEASDYDAQKSLAAFHEKHSLLLEQTEPAAKSSDTIFRIGQHRHFRTARLIAAVVVITLFCMVAAQALGYDVFGVIARWTEETFGFNTPTITEEAQMVTNLSDGTEYSSLQAALDDNGITESVAPSWYPSEFELSAITITSLTGELRFRAAYTGGERFLSVTVWVYETAEDADSGIFEKDDYTVSTYESGGVTHYLMSNEGQLRAAWTNQNIVCSISGDLSEDEMKKMIDSIYER